MMGCSGVWKRRSGWTAGAVLALCALVPSTARADKIFYKNGKFIQGIVKEEYPTRVEIFFEGRVLSIPRTRIETIEYESSDDNLKSIMAKIADALEREEAAEARTHLEAARALDTGGKFAQEIKGFETEIERLATHGTAEQRRAASEKYLAQAREQFDRIQIDKGIEFLLSSLATDPTYQPAHDLMARQLQEMIPPPVDLAIEYFADFVDLEQIKANHPFVSFAPASMVELSRRLSEATTEEALDKNTRRLFKLSRMIEAHPDWNYQASAAQQAYIDRGFTGLIEERLDADLKKGNYETALLRAQAWADVQPDAPDLERYYIRAWVGMADFERANTAMEALIEDPLAPEWAKLSFNALANYQTALDALKWGQDRQAEGLLATLLTLKGQLLPEVYQLIAKTKFEYDEPQIDAMLQRGDPSGAADIALRAFVYSVEPGMILKARNSFTELAPLLAFKPTFVWIVDGIEIPLHKDSLDIIKTHLGSLYGLRFSDISPFNMEIRLVSFTFDGTGEELLAQINDEKAYTVDIYEADDNVVEIELHISVSHPVAPDLYALNIEKPELPSGIKYGRKDDVLGTVFFPLLQHSSIDSWLQDDFPKYLPEDRMKAVYGDLKLPDKSEE